MAMFARSRDVSLVNKLNRELLGNVITQQASFYKYKLEETKVNLYGESAGEKFYDGPFIFNCLIDRDPQQYGETEEGIFFNQRINFYFFRQDLKDAQVEAEIGDIILYQEGYYGVHSTVNNQYWSGKNPTYPNEPNPLNPGLGDFGANISTLCECYYIPADKVAISPYKERF
jgi:hypothetical protein|tara:strand:- start:773 stop:1288 length:516 start_codon:yes stop_codon:yes gene_type:complete